MKTILDDNMIEYTRDQSLKIARLLHGEMDPECSWVVGFAESIFEYGSDFLSKLNLDQKDVNKLSRFLIQ